MGNRPEIYRQSYRPDIDGLRAVAVVAVILFHAFPEYVPSGFVGVDIFLVISGFLISGLTFDEVERGAFALSVFYVRRILSGTYRRPICCTRNGVVHIASRRLLPFGEAGRR
jgi:hypothetical protein